MLWLLLSLGTQCIAIVLESLIPSGPGGWAYNLSLVTSLPEPRGRRTGSLPLTGWPCNIGGIVIRSICVFICNLGIQQDRNTDDLRKCAFVYISIHKERLILVFSAEGKWYGKIVNKTNYFDISCLNEF